MVRTSRRMNYLIGFLIGATVAAVLWAVWAFVAGGTRDGH